MVNNENAYEIWEYILMYSEIQNWTDPHSFNYRCSGKAGQERLDTETGQDALVDSPLCTPHYCLFIDRPR